MTGSRLAHRLGVPLVHTGLSLGRSNRLRLVASGIKRSEIETTYNISRRIEAEETTLDIAERVITSKMMPICFVPTRRLRWQRTPHRNDLFDLAHMENITEKATRRGHSRSTGLLQNL